MNTQPNKVFVLNFDWVRGTSKGTDEYLYSETTVHSTLESAVQRTIKTARIVVKINVTPDDLYQSALMMETDRELVGVISGVGVGDEAISYEITPAVVDDPTDPQEF